MSFSVVLSCSRRLCVVLVSVSVVFCPVRILFSVGLCHDPAGSVLYSCRLVSLCVLRQPSVSHQCRLVSFRVAVRPGPAYVQCLVRGSSSTQCLWCPLKQPGARRQVQGEQATARQALDLSLPSALSATALQENVNRFAAICKPSKPSEPVSPGLALLGHRHNGWAPKSSIRKSG